VRGFDNLNKRSIEFVKVGDKRSASKVITKQDIEIFANLSGDFNPIHMDDDIASRTVFRSRIAHGMLVAGIISAALSKFPGIVIYKSQTMVFLRPVRPGDSIEASAEVTEKTDETSEVRIKITCQNQHGENVISGEAIIKVLQAEPAGADC